MPRRCEMNSATNAPANPAITNAASQTYPEIGDDIELTETERVGANAEIGAVTDDGSPAVPTTRLNASA